MKLIFDSVTQVVLEKRPLNGCSVVVLDEIKYMRPKSGWRNTGTVRTFYFTGTQKPWDCYKLYIDKSGDYVEK